MIETQVYIIYKDSFQLSDKCFYFGLVSLSKFSRAL